MSGRNINALPVNSVSTSICNNICPILHIIWRATFYTHCTNGRGALDFCNSIDEKNSPSRSALCFSVSDFDNFLITAFALCLEVRCQGKSTSYLTELKWRYLRVIIVISHKSHKHTFLFKLFAPSHQYFQCHTVRMVSKKERVRLPKVANHEEKVIIQWFVS
jgi:hypothetical protein